MKTKIPLSILIFSVIVPLRALEWERKAISVVAGYADKEVNAEYPFSNRGNEPVTITETKTSCGCAVVALDPATIPPGGQGKVRVTFTVGERYGEQKKRITVMTNEPGISPTNLELAVSLPPGPTITPLIQKWKVGSPPQAKTTAVLLPPGSPLKITEILSNNRIFELEHMIAEDGKSVVIILIPRTTERNHGISVTVRAVSDDGTIEKTYRVFGSVAEVAEGGD